eukprot:scaffold66904_cov37-Phaeocystis_antarctica.AAC.6
MAVRARMVMERSTGTTAQRARARYTCRTSSVPRPSSCSPTGRCEPTAPGEADTYVPVLRTVRTGDACRPLACCTCRRHRAAYHSLPQPAAGRALLHAYRPRACRTYRVPRHPRRWLGRAARHRAPGRRVYVLHADPARPAG